MKNKEFNICEYLISEDFSLLSGIVFESLLLYEKNATVVRRTWASFLYWPEGINLEMILTFSTCAILLIYIIHIVSMLNTTIMKER